ncbi:MAG: phosphoribosyltransferase family protein [Gammaproteobacteria bacterium]|nr:phosphoribosyltransferase family protein [Gammaproteobacteria bacterium]
MSPINNIHELNGLRNRTHTFHDRIDAGKKLAEMLSSYSGSDALILGIPAGGVPVAVEIASRLCLPLHLAVISKILLPWTTEAGYGAVAFDGSVWINEQLVSRFGLTSEDIEKTTQTAKLKVTQRVRQLHVTLPDLGGRSVIVVDDGLAAGSTMRVAISAIRNKDAGQIIVAVPTGSSRSVQQIANMAEALYCANIRTGLSFAVADAYERWSDVDQEEVVALLNKFGK